MPSKRLLYCILLLAASSWAAQTAVVPKKAHSNGNPARIFAPYLDVAHLPDNAPRLLADSGARYITLAFVNAGQGCAPTWPGAQSVDADTTISAFVAKLRTAGGHVIIAFGGYEGTELAQACSDVSSLQSAYQKVLDKYKPTALDFDVEHFAIADQPSIDRRNSALKNLAQANPKLRINFTLPATPAGLTDQSVNVLKSAVAQGVPVHIVNVMTMDYGPIANSNDMGANAISAIEGAQSQLKQLGMNAKLGITPMLGVNDVAGEVFKLADAASVLSYARKNSNVALLSFWSLGRDNASCTAVVSPTCSGISQKPWEFSRIFVAFH